VLSGKIFSHTANARTAVIDGYHTSAAQQRRHSAADGSSRVDHEIRGSKPKSKAFCAATSSAFQVNLSASSYVVVSTTGEMGRSRLMSSQFEVCVNRRCIMAVVPGLILLPAVIAACSSKPPTPAPSASGQPTESAAGTASTQIQQSQVPVGAAIVTSGSPPYVVAQPSAGQFVAFSAACTHRGTTVSAGDGTTLVCPAHGSQFNADTGAVLKGPAARPLAAVAITAANGVLTVG
jgi:cytochrome b6-f complex iron-sulfur subunit